MDAHWVDCPIYSLYPRPPPTVKGNLRKFLRGYYARADFPIISLLTCLYIMAPVVKQGRHAALGLS